LFLAYQRNIGAQFEILNNDWMNTFKGPRPGGFDLLVGQNVENGVDTSKTATLHTTATPPDGVDVTFDTFITPTGGAYLFAPSVSHLRSLASGEPPALPHADELGAFDAATSAAPADHDGRTVWEHLTDRHDLFEADWPEAALLPDAAASLSLPELQSLSMSGQHFPTDVLAPTEAARLSAQARLQRLTVDGVTLSGAALAELFRKADSLQSADLAGCDLDDAEVATLVLTRPSITEMRLGIAPPRSGHRFTAGRLTPRILQSLRTLEAIQRVGLRGVALADDDVAASDLWDTLESVDLGETGVADAGANRLSRTPGLREIVLDRTSVGDASAAQLFTDNVEILSLSWTRVTGAGLARVNGAPQLRRLELAGLRIDDGFADVVARLPALQHIDVANTAVGDRCATAVAALRQLTTANFASTAVTAAGLTNLIRSPARILDIAGLPLTAEHVEMLASATQLRRLTMSAGVDWAGLSDLPCAVEMISATPDAATPPPLLTALDLRGDLTPDLLAALAPLTRLQTLSVGGSITATSIPSGFSALTDLRAADASLDDGLLAGFLRLPTLRALYISGNPVGDSLSTIRGEYIHTIELRDTEIDDAALQAIAQLPRLHCIDVPGSRVTSGGVAQLAATAANLQSLALDGSQVDAPSAAALAAAPRLQELYLYGGDADLGTLQALRSVPIRDLQLVDTSISDDAVSVLVAMPRLRTLGFTDGTLSSAAVAALQELRPDIRVLA
jgi:hypothetical protein